MKLVLSEILYLVVKHLDFSQAISELKIILDDMRTSLVAPILPVEDDLNDGEVLHTQPCQIVVTPLALVKNTI